MNWLKAVFTILTKINFIVDLLIDILSNWNEKSPVENTAEKIKELQKLKK